MNNVKVLYNGLRKICINILFAGNTNLQNDFGLHYWNGGNV